MAKISMELLTREYKNYLKVKHSIDKTPNGKMTYSGKEMNRRYLFEDDVLDDETDHNRALMIIMRDHIERSVK